ncbi:hypothetical protein [Schleiferilactobacillus harbinensis]|uniref:Uncharacterized protein n=1 Tax=Schleiferilactobacillus harbinensis TaxID=304207 RepID=A0A5P8M7L1_9LACO|nr:hypothetical protein [Schleiferilactobacillus harbinensis]QFR24071.1 hypothetical protein D1010_12140 [Schleiferilactobacillus harbinensis]
MKKKDWQIIWRNVARNRFWAIKGLETMALGIFFMLSPGYMRDVSPFCSAVNYLDDPLPVLILLSVGFFAVISSCFKMEPNWRRGTIVVLQIIWALYAAAFLIRDINDSNPPMVGLATILFWFIVIQIYVEGLAGEPSDNELERGGQKRTHN